MSQVDVVIMGHAYRLNCPEGKETLLRHSAVYLDSKMSAIRESGKVKGNENIAVMAALGIASEALSVQMGQELDLSIIEIKQKIAQLSESIEAVLMTQSVV